MLGVRLPGTVRCLVLAHEQEGPIRISMIQPIQALLRDEIRRIALQLDVLSVLGELGIHISPLAREDRPVVETGG
jgi:hypothetical protein